MKKFISNTVVGLATIMAAVPALADDGMSHDKGYLALAAGICIAVAAVGGALGQGRAAAAALEGLGRNPGASDKLFVPLILSLALIESLVIYALVIAVLIVLKL